jgi:short-subunit dehydrogenase
MKSLRDRNALLTGAEGGIGPDIVRRLAREGVHLALSGLPDQAEALEALRDEARGLGVRAEVVPADLTQPGELDTLVERAEDAVGPLELLVNNAGVELTAAYAEFEREELEWIVQVNLVAPLVLTRHALRGMRERGKGHVVFMASLAGKMGSPYNHPYSATKFGLVGLTQSLRAEYVNTDISFSVICPGFVAGAGMFARMEHNGDSLPFMAATVSAADVATALVDAVVRDRAEVLVTARNVKPVLALQALAPNLAERLLRKTSPDEVFRHMAESRGRVGEPIEAKSR